MLMNSDEKAAFKKAVFAIVKAIPHGRATSYGAIARAAGNNNLSRMVGRLMSHSANENIPAHRVVNSQGILSGKESFGSNGEMQKLLENEDIVVENDKIKNWKKVFWDPLQEIN